MSIDLKCNKCGSGHLFLTLMACHFGPNTNSWRCKDCKAVGKVYEIDGTPPEQWPVQQATT